MNLPNPYLGYFWDGKRSALMNFCLWFPFVFSFKL
ncbi:hypothetical protein Ccrd_008280 [Cynara cardunculus var. scolymus]|uniref:Uncharacterized protein n=1 Tax=Cynara cardunculus var. scolymus TaxID=59895 RepID=A0A124SB72_CYNCS|nr:hypothetical protein Ccrd_008280 [Cynara cardunculus var. scolymus]